MINLNFSHKNEYKLNQGLINEAIQMYGMEVVLVKTEKLNLDHDVFGDWSSIKTSKDAYHIHALPSNADSIDTNEYQFGDFGFINDDTCTVYMSTTELFKYSLDVDDLMSSLVILPSNKIMEITDVKVNSDGINNLWGYSDVKTSFIVTMRQYNINSHDELNDSIINTLDIEVEDTESVEDVIQETVKNYDPLDNYMEKLFNDKKSIEFESEVKEVAEVVKPCKPNVDKVVKKPIVNKQEIGRFGW